MWIKDEVKQNQKRFLTSKAEVLDSSATRLQIYFRVLKIHWFRVLELTYFTTWTNSETYYIL